MTTEDEAAVHDLLVSECAACHTRFVPRPGRCPKCGSGEVAPRRVPPVALVLAATELTAPAAGWSAPHRLALAELEGGIRLLGVVRGALPARGRRVQVARDQAMYVFTPEES